MSEQITITGQCSSVLYAGWECGPVSVSFTLSGGTGTGTAIWNAQVTDFRATLAGQPLMVLPSTTANYQLSPFSNDSGLVVWGPQYSELVWLFSGPTWAPGPGYYQSEEMAYNFQFNTVKVANVAEPATFALLAIALLMRKLCSK